jgi:hypothetical protein
LEIYNLKLGGRLARKAYSTLLYLLLCPNSDEGLERSAW